MVEVKPYKQVQEPKVQNRKTKRYINEVKTFAINTYKWKAAREFCEDRDWEFVIITETSGLELTAFLHDLKLLYYVYKISK